MIGAIGGGEWCESCARGLRLKVAAGPYQRNLARKVGATDHAGDNDADFPRQICRMAVGAGGALKSALELRLRQREEGGPARRRLLGV